MQTSPQCEVLDGTTWDIVVIGAGPAGSMAARESARRGAAVLLVDKAPFPRYKVCGCCINRRALSILDAAGLGDLAAVRCAPELCAFAFSSARHHTTLPLPGGIALSREKFDLELAESAQRSGARFISGWAARVGESTGNTREVELRRGEVHIKARARIVLAACGLGHKLMKSTEAIVSRPAAHSRIGAGAMLPEAPSFYVPGTIYMALGKRGYVGLVRLEDHRLNLAAAFDAPYVRECGGLAQAARCVLRDAGVAPLEGLESSIWRGTPPLTRKPTKLSAHRLLLLGDAAGYVEPFTGEGISWALNAGAAVAPIACAALKDFGPETERQWEKAYREIIGRRHRACAMIAAGLRHPWLVGALTSLLTRAPRLASPVIRALNEPSRVPKELLS